MFGTIAVQGLHVEKCLGYRIRSLDAAPCGNMLFIDARACGKPVCCRLFKTCIFRVEDFLEELGTSFICCEVRWRYPVGGDPLVLMFQPSTSATIWVEHVAPELPICDDSSQDAEDGGGGRDPGDDLGEDEDFSEDRGSRSVDESA